MAPRRREEGAPAIGVALSFLLHGAVLGGLVWWGLREKPAEAPAQGLELIWDQPAELGLEGEAPAAPGAPPEVPALDAEPAPPEAPAAPPVASVPPAMAPPPIAGVPRVAPPPPPSRLAALPDNLAPPPPIPPAANGLLSPPTPPTPPQPPIQERQTETPTITAAVPDVRVPPLDLPREAPPAQRETPPQATATPPRPAPRPVRQASAARNPRPAEPPGAGAAETSAATSGGGAVARGATMAASDDPNFPRSRPRYPPSALARGEQGNVYFSMTVGPDGRVQAFRLIRGSGYPALDEEARRHVLQNWRFRPALRDGEPVTATQETGIVFTLE